jgi:hypothetical protein
MFARLSARPPRSLHLAISKLHTRHSASVETDALLWDDAVRWLRPGGGAAAFEFLEPNQWIQTRFETGVRLRTAPMSLRDVVARSAASVHLR